MNAATIKTLFASMAFIAGLAAYSGDAHASFTVVVDCHGNNQLPSWADSWDTFTIEAYIQFPGQDAHWTTVYKGILGSCRGDDGGIYPFGLSVADIHKHIRVTTNGTDTEFIDKITIYDGWATQQPDLLNLDIFQRWGVDNNVGYCMSKDPSDGNNAYCTGSTAYSSMAFSF